MSPYPYCEMEHNYTGFSNLKLGNCFCLSVCVSMTNDLADFALLLNTKVRMNAATYYKICYCWPRLPVRQQGQG